MEFNRDEDHEHMTRNVEHEESRPNHVGQTAVVHVVEEAEDVVRSDVKSEFRFGIQLRFAISVFIGILVVNFVTMETNPSNRLRFYHFQPNSHAPRKNHKVENPVKCNEKLDLRNAVELEQCTKEERSAILNFFWEVAGGVSQPPPKALYKVMRLDRRENWTSMRFCCAV